MENQVNDQQDEELESQYGSVEEEKFEDTGEIKPEEPQVPKLDLKSFLKD
jgi:hypothetical protein